MTWVNKEGVLRFETSKVLVDLLRATSGRWNIEVYILSDYVYELMRESDAPSRKKAIEKAKSMLSELCDEIRESLTAEDKIVSTILRRQQYEPGL